MAEKESKNERDRILIVDDEVNILRSLKRLLRREGYEIRAAESGQAGLEILKKEPVDLIISDQRMPGMSGVEFLEKAQKICPESIRMILSGYTDLNSVTDAVNRGYVFKFVLKPWDDNELKQIIHQSLSMARLQKENRQLAEQLKKRNEKLRWLNTHLEEKVADRTRELELRNTVLEKFQQILHEMPIGVLGMADDGVIAFANTWAKKHLAQPGTLLINQHLSSVCGPEIKQAFDKLVQDGKIFSLNWNGPEKNSVIEVRGAVVRHSGGTRGYVLLFIENRP